MVARPHRAGCVIIGRAAMQIYNTLTRRKEPISPITPGQIKMYSCGPTVYRYIHIGNLRTFTMADWLRRSLTYAGLEVLHIKNITDVGHMRVELLDRGEDKLIAQARKEGKRADEIAAFYTDAFLEDEARLNILPAHRFPRASAHVPDMIAIIAGLLKKGIAYQSGGNIYYDVARFPGYGALSGNQIAQLLEGVRDRVDSEKRNQEDFALWKAAEAGREMAWDSPWGHGFPGWHIECSAMSMKYLGSRFDLHTGGVDNIFPHHEDEIAQSEGYTGERFVNTWIHAQHLLVDGLKMAKSTGNAYTRADIEARGFDPLALRYFYTTAHYRSRINFTFTALKAAQTSLRRLRMAALRLAEQADRDRLPGAAALRATHWQRRFDDAIMDDLNMPRAMAGIWDMLRRAGDTTPAALQLALLLDFDRVLGFGLAEWLRAATKDQGRKPSARLPLALGPSPGIPEPIAALVRRRADLRQQQRFAEADALRAQIADEGYVISDTQRGPLVTLRALEQAFSGITRSADVPDMSAEPDLYEFSVNLLARDSCDDLQRCVASIARHHAGQRLEIVIVDNGSTDNTVPYLQALMRSGLHADDGTAIPVHVLFADHNMGFAAGRNATMRASRGRTIILLDSAIELCDDIWSPLARALADPSVGVVGPYGLVTSDLREFYENDGPDVDAIEGYLMAFRRALLPEVGWAEEKFRFYRLLDIYYSFMFKTAGYRAVVTPDIAARITKHPHREWFGLTEEERATKSKKNYDIFKRRWHHGQSLLVENFVPGDHWFGHDHPQHLGPSHDHAPADLPPPGQMHSHLHQHWPDHAHTHPHSHAAPADRTSAAT
jgi:cysteinyl-tRNA synthetase